jgi:hypothetical protein
MKVGADKHLQLIEAARKFVSIDSLPIDSILYSETGRIDFDKVEQWNQSLYEVVRAADAVAEKNLTTMDDFPQFRWAPIARLAILSCAKEEGFISAIVTSPILHPRPKNIEKQMRLQSELYEDALG